MERHRQQQIQFMQQEFCRRYRTPDASEQVGQEEKSKIGKEIGKTRRSHVGGMEALRWILLCNFIGVKMQMVEAVEEEIPACQEMEHPAKREVKTARVRTQGTLKTKSQVGGPKNLSGKRP